MSTRRQHVSLTTKLAAALLTIRVEDPETGRLVPVINYEEAKTLTAKQILSRFEFAHGIAHALGGPIAPWNLTPKPKATHREETARVDIPAIAKTKRLARVSEEFQRTVLARPCGQKRQSTGKIRSRGFDKGRSKKMNGKVVKR